MQGGDDRSEDPLRQLEKAARAAMLRSRPWPPGTAPCSTERSLVAFLVDFGVGIACWIGGAVALGLLFDSVAAAVPDLVGESVVSLFLSSFPLVYSAMDLLVGTTPGKTVMRVRIDGPPPVRLAVFKRWAVKGSPFVIASAISMLRLVHALGYARYEFWLTGVTVWSILIGSIWWIVASVAVEARTLPDIVAGTRLVTGQGGRRPHGFEAVLKDAS